MGSLSASALIGIGKAVEKLTQAADSISKLGTSKEDGDLVRDIVEIKSSQNAYKANLALLEKDKEITESTLDILA